MVLRTAQQIEGGLPTDIQAMMLFNIILDFGIGLVPFLGDVADALFKANTRNAVILEKYLRKKGAAALKAEGKPAPAIDPSDPVEFDKHIAALGPPPGYTESAHSQEGASHEATPSNPQTINPTQTTNNKATSKSGGGGFFGKKTKQTDLEQGGGVGSQSQQPVNTKSTLQKDRR